ncbi:Nickel uptake substrate-specific transmembrane region [Planctomycetes bacterium Pla86]|uniref:Nickel uptake substrate-specific transmembrane region n=2 Tax=Engelhardtia mirabilis TaxID=2528011 RepID=A0A518BM49_9BACT|nr:Nickel uptake substrate-specific transmembrane region [Planctomycetes bacterium Pla133]QDV02385.1 Nickel uptake substrate-specific transmembrane region [Planctomycetes bacterium Pla86]
MKITSLCILAIGLAGSARLLPSQPQDEQAKSSATVEGVFVDQDGAPLEGVHVLNRIWPGAESSTESDGDGHFEILLEWDGNKDGTWYEGYARKEGRAMLKFRADLRAGQEFDFGRLTLTPGGVLSGEVLDASGAPLSGAMLLVVDAAQQASAPEGAQADGPPWEQVIDRGSTDASGAYEIIGVPPGTWFIVAKHESTWWLWSEPIRLEAGKRATASPFHLESLPAEYQIQGRVVDPGDKPVANAQVATSVLSPDGRFMMQTTARTDESGQFVLFFSRLPSGTVDLRVQPEGDELDDGSLLDVSPGARDLVVHLGGTKVLRLHVVDDTGRPVERYGWGLSIDKPGSFVMTGSAPAFHEGGYATLRVPEHPFELEIRSDAHDRKEIGAFTPDALPKVLEITLTSSQAISGYVTFQGRPVPDVFVELVQRTPNYLDGVVEGHWNGLYYGLESSTTHTDQSGRFRIPNDFPHITYYARAWADGYAEGTSGPVKVGATGVHVELGVGGEIAGVVSVPRGLPPGGIELEFYREEIKASSINTSVGKILRTITDDDGSYSQPHLDPGTWLVRVHPSGTLLSDLGWSEAKVEAESHPYVVTVQDQDTTYFDIALGRDEPCILEGRISVGDKIREGYSELLLEGPFALDLDFSGVDEHGRFRLVARSSGKYRLVINAGPGHHQYKTITDLVELVPGTNAWERDLPVDQWTGEGIRLDAH